MTFYEQILNKKFSDFIMKILWLYVCYIYTQYWNITEKVFVFF